MKHLNSSIGWMLFIISWLFIGANNIFIYHKENQLKKIVSQFNRAADECYYAVLEKNQKYEQVLQCNQLGTISTALLNASGDDFNRVSEYKIAYLEARETAWKAVVISNSMRQSELLGIW